jgi:hypothetical protein
LKVNTSIEKYLKPYFKSTTIKLKRKQNEKAYHVEHNDP